MHRASILCSKETNMTKAGLKRSKTTATCLHAGSE
jgi:hypothetical protein